MTSPAAPRARRGRRLPTTAQLPLAGFAAAYALAVLAGRATRLEGSQLALVEPAAAVGLLWLTYAWSRGRVAGSASVLLVLTVLVSTATGAPGPVAVGLGAAGLVQALGAAALLRRQRPAPARLRSTRDLLALALACAGGALASAPLSGLVLWASGAASLGPAVVAVGLRDVSSALVLGALALRLADRGAASGVRSRTAGSAAAAVLVVAVVALTAAGRGPFALEDAAVRALLAQGFVSAVALVVLTLALSADERDGLVDRLRSEQRRSTAQAAMLETVLDTVDVAIVACDAGGRLTLANRTARELALDREPATGATTGLFRTDGTTGLEPDELPLAQALRAGHVREPLLTVARADAPARTVHCVGRALRDEAGTLLGAVVVHSDVTALRASEQQFRAAFEDGPTPMARLSCDGTVEQANAALRRFLVLTSRGLTGTDLAELAVPEDRERLRAAVVERSGGLPVEVRLRRTDGGAVWCEVTTTVVRAPDGQSYVLAHVLDVHTRKVHELALEDVARRDPLTGVDNRLVLDRRLGELLQARDATVVLAYLDLDGFKQVNDEHGHEAGDAVLRAVGSRLLRLVRSGDVAVRVGGDEFVLACPVPAGSAAAHFATALSERVEAALSEPVVHGGTTLEVGVSVGTALAAPGSAPDAVLHQADLAMYASKRARKLRASSAAGGQEAAAPPAQRSGHDAVSPV